MNAKALYIGILIVLLILIFGVSESFVWVNPDFEANKMGPNCQVRQLVNCSVIDPRRPAYCLRCIMDDRNGGRQPFVPKFKGTAEQGKGGCELNTENPGVDANDEYTSEDNWCTPGDNTRWRIVQEGGLGNEGQYGCAHLKDNAANKGASRLTNVPAGNYRGGCLPGAVEESHRFGFQKYIFAGEWTGECKQKDHYKTRCVLPVSTLKQWAQEKKIVNGLNMGDIDELPATGNLYGNYYKAWATGVYGC